MTALIIDDERLARLTLKKKLFAFAEIDVIGEASGVVSGVRAVNDLKPDLLFLDVQMLDGTGFDLLEKVNYRGQIVFVTAYDKYALRAFEVNALDYLLKPVSDKKLKKVINNISSADKGASYSSINKFEYDDRIMIEHKGQIYFIFIKDIMKISSAKDYTVINTDCNRTFCVLNSMNDWENKLPENHFFRAHRTTIINFNFIETTIRVGATAEVYLKGSNEAVKVSRGYYKILRDKYFYK